MASSASGMCECAKECTIDDLLHQGQRADYGATPTVFGWSTALFELATLAVLVITTMRRKTHPACRRASPALTMLTTLSCAAVFGVSWLWADDDITISETLSGAAECNVAEDEEGMTEVKRDGCSSCALRVWLTVYAMTLLWGSVLLRLLRTDAASNTQRRGGSFSRLSSARLLIPFGLGPLLGFQTVVLIIYSAVDAPSLDHANYPTEMMKTEEHKVCWSQSSGTFWTVEFLLGMVLLGYCLKVAKGTQKLVKKNAEVDEEHGLVAKQLSANAGLALVSCVLLAILMNVNDDEYIALACIRTIGLQFFGLGVLVSAVVPLALPRGLACEWTPPPPADLLPGCLLTPRRALPLLPLQYWGMLPASAHSACHTASSCPLTHCARYRCWQSLTTTTMTMTRTMTTRARQIWTTSRPPCSPRTCGTWTSPKR